MRGVIYLAAVAGAALLPLAAAQAQDANKASVDSFVCQFSGKCGDAAEAEPAEAEEAPATKGFSLARPKGQDSAAPATKGFSMARPKGQDAAAPATRGFSMARPKGQDAAAPASRGFSMARPTKAAATAPAPAVRARPGRRPVASAPAAVAPSGPRADLMLSFELNSAEMTSGAKDRARVFAQALNTAELKSHRFAIEGHTDSVGGRAANLDLSRRRAQSVADYLVAQGVDRSRLEVKGMAFDRPLPGKGVRAVENRRVEAALIS